MYKFLERPRCSQQIIKVLEMLELSFCRRETGECQ